MPTREVLKRLEALEEAKVPASEAVKIIRLTSPHPRPESFGTALDMGGRKLFFPGDPSESEDVLAAMYWQIYPEGKRVILATETDEPDVDALIIQPCPPGVGLSDYVLEQVERLA
ncbi:hypothetical protein [Halomonas sp.]|uniref:hypothetical protein n=1 Tax=Halomonas sp. TaxID=1486246 RepID=UPI003A907445